MFGGDFLNVLQVVEIPEWVEEDSQEEDSAEEGFSRVEGSDALRGRQKSRVSLDRVSHSRFENTRGLSSLFFSLSLFRLPALSARSWGAPLSFVKQSSPIVVDLPKSKGTLCFLTLLEKEGKHGDTLFEKSKGKTGRERLFLAHCFPYTYSDLRRELSAPKKIRAHRQILVKSLLHQAFRFFLSLTKERLLFGNRLLTFACLSIKLSHQKGKLSLSLSLSTKGTEFLLLFSLRYLRERDWL